MSLKFNMCEGEMLMRTEDLEKITPYTNGVWDKENLIEYLIWKCDRRFSTWIDEYFSSYLNDWQLAELLFDIVLDDDFDGFDARMSAAYFISQLSEDILKEKKDLLIKAQENEVEACRPLSYIKKSYDWL